MLVPDVSEDDKRPYRKQMWNNLLCLTHMHISISSSIFLELEKRHISSISIYSHVGSPVSPSLFLLNLFSQLFSMSIPETHFIYKHLFRYSAEYASCEKGLRSFTLFFLTFLKDKRFPQMKINILFGTAKERQIGMIFFTIIGNKLEPTDHL